MKLDEEKNTKEELKLVSMINFGTAWYSYFWPTGHFRKPPDNLPAASNKMVNKTTESQNLEPKMGK